VTDIAFYRFDRGRAVANEAPGLRAGVRQFLGEQPAASTGVVAVSGGPDSVALLRALLLETTGTLVIAHLNHQLRGAESDADEAFVRRLHEQLAAASVRLLLRCSRLDVRAESTGDNLESAGRRLRYEWLTEVARATGAAWVVTGHTAEDQAETVLHRLLRGTGLRGLAGIPRRRALAPGIQLVRPLLHVRRAEILAFLEQLGQPFRSDSSNLDRYFTRNRLRYELLPLLAREYNPAVADVLNRLAEQADEVQTFLAERARALLTAVELPRAGKTIVLDARWLAEAPALLVREALRMLWEREVWPMGEMGFEDWQRALKVVRGEESAVDFPAGVRMRRMGHVVQVVPLAAYEPEA
jgi:tRNA(Ile)-lysidine synthase